MSNVASTIRAAACAAALCLAPAAIASTPAPPPVGFDVTLAPRTDGHGHVVGLSVIEQIDAVATGAPLSLVLPAVMPGAPRNADAISGLIMHDSAGALEVDVTDSDDGASFPLRRWTTRRAVQGRVEVRYQAALQRPQAGGPPYGMKAAGHGVAGSTKSFLLIPENSASRASRLAWDLSQLPEGAIGVATGGQGTLRVSGPPAAMDDRWLLAGPAVAGQTRPRQGFNAYAIGTPPFELRAEMDWARRAYDALAQAFGYLPTPRYDLLIRVLDIPSFETGTARVEGGGALITLGNVFSDGYDIAALHSLLVHEMAHQWTGQLTSGIEPWYAEGLNVFAEVTVPCRAGVMPWSACAAAINQRLGDLYASEGRRWPLQQINEVGFSNEIVRRVPYARGMLYFASVDAKLRRRSDNTRGLLDAIQPLFVARQAGGRFEQGDLEALLARELGPDEIGRFRRVVIEGTEDPAMPADLFGTQLQRVPQRWATPQGDLEGYKWEAAAATASVK